MIDFTECDAGQETLEQEVEQFRRALMEELHCVRRITATHPSIAPPQVA